MTGKCFLYTPLLRKRGAQPGWTPSPQECKSEDEISEFLEPETWSKQLEGSHEKRFLQTQPWILKPDGPPVDREVTQLGSLLLFSLSHHGGCFALRTLFMSQTQSETVRQNQDELLRPALVWLYTLASLHRQAELRSRLPSDNTPAPAFRSSFNYTKQGFSEN